MIHWLLLACVLAALLVAAWWVSLKPSNDRDWADEVSRTVRGTVQGSRVTLQDIRDFDWRSTTDYTARWHDGRYDLDELTSVDMALSYWMGPAIAHTMVSFGFADGRHVVLSVEIRRERDEAFSVLGGFTRQFELAIVAAEERDILQVRAGPRGEQVFLYPVLMPAPAMRALFRSYVARANRLAHTPRFYNTVTANCTTLIYDMVRPLVPGLPMDIRLILSGYLPEYLYHHHGLDTSVPLDVLRARSDITRRAAAPDASAQAFSRRIRTTEAQPQAGAP